MHLVGDRQARDAVFLDPEGLTAHRAADERTALDALGEKMLRDLEAVAGEGAEGEARDEAAFAGLGPEFREGLTVELNLRLTSPQVLAVRATCTETIKSGVIRRP
jgi:hypothetical protein